MGRNTNLSSPLKGRKQTPEHIAKRVASRKKNPKAMEQSRNIALANSEKWKNRKHSEESKAKISEAMKGKKNALGTVRSLEFKENLSEYWKDNPNHNFYKDGKGVERRGKRRQDMGRLQYREWRSTVFERDNYTCQICGVRGGNLEADHIKSYAAHPELRYNVDNGRTLCKKCHKKTDNFGIKAMAQSDKKDLNGY